MVGEISRGYGVLARWNDARGFGFVIPHDGDGDVFAHISAFPGTRRPAEGDRVQFTASRDASGRLRADAVRFDGTNGQPHSRSPRRHPGRSLERLRWAAGVSAFATLLVIAIVRFGGGPMLMLPGGVYLLMSLLTFAAYRRDKAAANRGRWRVAESTLHIVALLGGWPGAFLAQVSLRHKTIKVGFQTGFWMTVVANLAVLALVPTSWIAEAAALLAAISAG